MHGFEETKITLFTLLRWIATWCGLGVGLVLGAKWFGLPGSVVGALIGFFAGNIIGLIPDWLGYRYFFKEIERSSDDKLRAMLADGEWQFWHTIALLQLSARGHDVQPELPRILCMLEADSVLTRRFGFDALRLVFTELAQKIPDYDPKEPTQTCRQKIALLRNDISTSPNALPVPPI